MEEIEYLEEYEDLILPMSFAVDDAGKCNERLDRKSIDSLEMLYKDLIEETSLPHNQPDTSPFSLNPQMISPEKTILPSSTVEIGLAHSFPNYSLQTTATTYTNTTHTETLHSHQAQTTNIQYLNRLASKSFSTYSSLQKPDKHKSVATVKPTLQRSYPPKQREPPLLKGGPTASQSQHNFTKPSSTKTSLALNNVTKSKSSSKPSKSTSSGLDSLVAGLDDDALLDFDEKNGLVDGFDFESDLDNSIIAGLSDMDSDSVELSEDFIDENFDLDSDLSSEGSDLKKVLKRRRSQMNSLDSSERQNNKASNDAKRDSINSIKKKLLPGNKATLEVQSTQKTSEVKEKTPAAISSAPKEAPFVVYSTKVNDVLANGSSIFPQLSGKINDHEHAHVADVLNLTPTLPLYSHLPEKSDIVHKQVIGISLPSMEKSVAQKKDERNHSVVDPFKGFDDSLTHTPTTDDVTKVNIVEKVVHSTSPISTDVFKQKEVPLDKSPRPKFGSLYLRAIKPPCKVAPSLKSPTGIPQQQEPSTKAPEESVKALQEKVSTTTSTKIATSSNTIANAAVNISKTSNAELPKSDAVKAGEKRASIPKISEAKEKEPPPMKRGKSLGSLTTSKPSKEPASAPDKVQDSMDSKPKTPTQSKAQKSALEPISKKDPNLARTPESKQKDPAPKPKVQTQTTTSLPIPKIQEAKEVDVPNKSKAQSQTKQKVVAAEEKIASKIEKVSATPKTQDHNVADKLTAPTQPKLKSAVEKTTVAIEKSSTPKVNEVKERAPPESSDVKAHITRRKSCSERSRNTSKDRVADKKAPSTESKEREEKDKEPERNVSIGSSATTQSSSTQNKVSKVLPTSATASQGEADKISTPSQPDETPSQKETPTLAQNTSSPLKRRRRKRFASRKLNDSNSNEKNTSLVLQKVTNPPSSTIVQVSTPVVEKSTTAEEPQKSPEQPVPQKEPPQDVPINAEAPTLPASKISQEVKSSKRSKRMFRSMSPSKVSVSELKKPKLRHFKVRLNRKTVDHFIKTLQVDGTTPQRILKDDATKTTPQQTLKDDATKTTPQRTLKDDGTKTTPQRNLKDDPTKATSHRTPKDDPTKATSHRTPKDDATKTTHRTPKDDATKTTPQPTAATPESKTVQTPTSSPQSLVSPRPAGRPRKITDPTVGNSPLSSKQNENSNGSQQPEKSIPVESAVNVTQSVDEVSPVRTLKRRRKRVIHSNRPAKILRSDTSSRGTSITPGKDSSSEQALFKQPPLPQAPISAVRKEDSALTAPVETAASKSAKVISPVASTKTIPSPSVPIVASSPTIPTKATSPAVPTDANSLDTTITSPSSDSPPSEASSPFSPTNSKKRGRPFSKKTLRRAAITRRLELIRASTSQRLPSANVDRTPEEPTPEPVPESSTDLADESLHSKSSKVSSPTSTLETIEAASSPTSQPTAPPSTFKPPEITNEKSSSSTSQPSEQITETPSPLISQPPIQTAASQSEPPPDGPRVTIVNFVQPKTENCDPGSPSYGMSGLIFDGAPAVYSFVRPTEVNRENGDLLLDACQMVANSFSMEQSTTTENVTVYDLPSYIVMRTRIITRNDLQTTKTALPAQVKETINKLAESGHVASPVKEELPDFKDICLEINTLLGRNANYLKFASSSERQARMNQVLSDSSLTVQEAQSALKFLQSYLSVRAKNTPVTATTAKGQQLIPIYDSQKKVIGYRKRRVHPKRLSQTAETSRQQTRQQNRSSNISSRTTSTSGTASANETLIVQTTVAQFTTKKEPQTTETGEEELIVPDMEVTANRIKSEVES